jgi:hypothetical protein
MTTESVNDIIQIVSAFSFDENTPTAQLASIPKNAIMPRICKTAKGANNKNNTNKNNVSNEIAIINGTYFFVKTWLLAYCFPNANYKCT